MKILNLFFVFLATAATALAQTPDPGDSIILESKTAAPGYYPGSGTDTAAYLYVKVYITNVDSITYLTLPLKEVSTSGGAYAILGYPRTFAGIITPLTPYFRGQMATALNKYNSTSPDSFLAASGFDPVDPSTIAPPFNVRTAIWEIKFDSVWNNPGTFELDSATVFGLEPTFTNTVPQDLPVNFVKSVITVRPLPDPRDSVILESKSVLPGYGYPAFTMRVYITNKDSLKLFSLMYSERALEGEVRAVEHERCCGWKFVNYLTNTLRDRGVCLAIVCEPADAETVLTLGYSVLSDPSTIEPPNAVRKAIWELQFDSAVGGPGVIEFDTARWGSIFTSFTNIYGQELPVNFVKSVITVRPKGDFNLDGNLSSADVVEHLNCIFDSAMQGGGAYPCDLNCDGVRSPADVIWELYAVFMGQAFPC